MALSFGHLVLRTKQPTAMQAWYLAVLDARVMAREDHAVFLSYDDHHHRLALVADATAPVTGPGALAHVAFAHDSITSLLAAYQRLAGLGIEPRRAVDHGHTASLYYRDPDDNELELYADVADRETAGYFFDRIRATPRHAR